LQENHERLVNYISVAPDQSRGKIEDAISKDAEVIKSLTIKSIHPGIAVGGFGSRLVAPAGYLDGLVPGNGN
jgi:hypothetical protein